MVDVCELFASVISKTSSVCLVKKDGSQLLIYPFSRPIKAWPIVGILGVAAKHDDDSDA